jgi:hypothetical protein
MTMRTICLEPVKLAHFTDVLRSKKALKNLEVFFGCGGRIISSKLDLPFIRKRKYFVLSFASLTTRPCDYPAVGGSRRTKF